MIEAEKLLEQGYREYTDSRKNADSSFQKRIQNNKNETMYFLNFHMYDYTTLRFASQFNDLGIRWDSDAGLYLKDTSYFRVGKAPEDHDTLEDIENFYQEIYKNMNCIPDVHNNDQYD
jgi:hypothetical protein